MANQHTTFDERFAALDERVTNLRSSFSTLEASTQRGFQQMDSALDNLGRDIRSNQKTPWANILTGLGVLLTFLGLVGYLVYSPIQGKQGELTSSIEKLGDLFATIPDKFITRAEQQVLRDRANQDRDTLTDTLAGKVGRDEWSLSNEALRRDLDRIEKRLEARTP